MTLTKNQVDAFDKLYGINYNTGNVGIYMLEKIQKHSLIYWQEGETIRLETRNLNVQVGVSVVVMGYGMADLYLKLHKLAKILNLTLQSLLEVRERSK